MGADLSVDSRHEDIRHRRATPRRSLIIRGVDAESPKRCCIKFIPYDGISGVRQRGRLNRAITAEKVWFRRAAVLIDAKNDGRHG